MDTSTSEPLFLTPGALNHPVVFGPEPDPMTALEYQEKTSWTPENRSAYLEPNETLTDLSHLLSEPEKSEQPRKRKLKKPSSCNSTPDTLSPPVAFFQSEVSEPEPVIALEYKEKTFWTPENKSAEPKPVETFTDLSHSLSEPEKCEQPKKRKSKKPSSFSCHICHKSYRYNYNLSRHLRYECQKDKSMLYFQCLLCDRKFPHRQNCYLHVKRVHNISQSTEETFTKMGE